MRKRGIDGFEVDERTRGVDAYDDAIPCSRRPSSLYPSLLAATTLPASYLVAGLRPKRRRGRRAPRRQSSRLLFFLFFFPWRRFVAITSTSSSLSKPFIGASFLAARAAAVVVVHLQTIDTQIWLLPFSFLLILRRWRRRRRQWRRRGRAAAVAMQRSPSSAPSSASASSVGSPQAQVDGFAAR